MHVRSDSETFIFVLPKSDFFFGRYNDTARFSPLGEELSVGIGAQTNLNPATGRAARGP